MSQKRWRRRKNKLQHNINVVKEKRRDLDLGKLRDRLRDAKNQRGRKKKAREEFIHVRENKRETLEVLLDKGHLTVEQQKRAKELEYEIGQADLRAEELHTVISRRTQLIRRLKPKNRARTRQQKDLRKRLEERKKRLRAAIRKHRRAQQQAADQDGISIYDGKPVASHFVPWLNKIRAAGWNGVLVSGYRTPEYSESLCYAMCGQPTCPGRCAGRYSKHSQKVPIDGAVDLSDYYTAGAKFRQVGAPYFNALGAADPVHFSNTGH